MVLDVDTTLTLDGAAVSVTGGLTVDVSTAMLTQSATTSASYTGGLYEFDVTTFNVQGKLFRESDS